MRSNMVWLLMVFMLFAPVVHISHASSEYQILEVNRIEFTDPDHLIEPYITRYHDIRLPPISISDNKGNEYWMILRKKPIILHKDTLEIISTDFDLPADYNQDVSEYYPPPNRCFYFVEDYFFYWYYEKGTEGVLKKYQIMNTSTNHIEFQEESSMVLLEFNADPWERWLNTEYIVPYVSQDRVLYSLPPPDKKNILHSDMVLKDMKSGEKVWSKTFDENSYAAIISILHQEIALLWLSFQGSGENGEKKGQYLYGINLEDGEILWELPIEDHRAYLRQLVALNYSIDDSGTIVFDEGSSLQGFVLSGVKSFNRFKKQEEYEYRSLLINTKGELIAELQENLPYALLDDASSMKFNPIAGNHHFISGRSEDGHSKIMVFFNYTSMTIHPFSVPRNSPDREVVEYLTSPILIDGIMLAGDYNGKSINFYEFRFRDDENALDRAVPLRTYHRKPHPSKKISDLFVINKTQFGLLTLDALHIYETIR